MGDPRHASTAVIPATDEATSNLLPLDYAKLFSQLLFAARNLAQSRIATEGSGLVGWVECSECRMLRVNGALVHLNSCRTGVVLDLVRQICDAAGEAGEPDSTIPIGKETLRAETPDEAGSAATLPVLICEGCGREDCPWEGSECAEGKTLRVWPDEPVTYHEPWTQRGAWEQLQPSFFGSDLFSSAQLTSNSFGDSTALIRRIVACVNFCTGVPTATLEDQRPMQDVLAPIDRQVAAGRVLSMGGAR